MTKMLVMSGVWAMVSHSSGGCRAEECGYCRGPVHRLGLFWQNRVYPSTGGEAGTGPAPPNEPEVHRLGLFWQNWVYPSTGEGLGAGRAGVPEPAVTVHAVNASAMTMATATATSAATMTRRRHPGGGDGGPEVAVGAVVVTVPLIAVP
jgi:hypothetical protein